MVTIDNHPSAFSLLFRRFFQAAGGLGHSTRRLIDPALGFFPALRGRGKTEKKEKRKRFTSTGANIMSAPCDHDERRRRRQKPLARPVCVLVGA